MTERRLPGGRSFGAVRVGDEVRRPTQPWTATVHSVLRHLEDAGFDGAPRARGFDDQGRERLTFLPGQTLGETQPWPDWLRSDDALRQVGAWLRRLHGATATFRPAADAVWFTGRTWQPGRLIAHLDASPWNAVWTGGTLAGFVDWDTASPSQREDDLAFSALTWVPLLTAEIAEHAGFGDAADRRRRFHLFLDAYGYTGDRTAIRDAIIGRVERNVAMIRQLADGGEPTFQRMLPWAADLERSGNEVAELPSEFWQRRLMLHRRRKHLPNLRAGRNGHARTLRRGLIIVAMRLPRPLMLQSAPWDSGTAPDGPAMTALRTIIARVAIILRGTALADMLVQVIIWHSFYLAKPWLLWGPLVALAWGSMAVAYLRSHRPSWQFACADSLVYAALALTAASCVPAAMRGEAGSWLFILVTSQVIVPIWLASEAWSVPLAVTPAIAFAVGTVLVPPAHPVTASLRNASVALLFLVVAGHWLVRLMLRTRAVRADTALAAADRDARDQYVILSRNIEQREQDRLLHDTVLNTLTAIARSGSSTAIGQCRQDIAMLERALSESGDAATGGSPEAGPLAAIAAVVSEMRARGLIVDLQIAGGGPAAVPNGLPAKHGANAPAPVPHPIAAAMAQATREALANVAAHAGTGKAWVTARLTPPGEGGTARPGQLRITIRDVGAGFDVSRVEPGRLGVRRSITERVEDWGGSASVQSAPGEGTTVCLSWPAAGIGKVPQVVKAASAGAGQGGGQW